MNTNLSANGNLSASSFEDIAISVKPKRTPQLIVLYGKPGTHKTTAACHAESPVIIPIGSETGHEKMHIPKYENSKGIDGLLFVERCIRHLLDTDHTRKTVILDNLGEYHDLVVSDIIAKNPKSGDMDVKSINDYGFGRGNAMVYPYFTKLFAGLRALQIKKNMDVIVIAHECHYNINLPDDKYYQKIGLNVQGGEKTSVRDLIERKADFVLYMQRVDKTRVNGKKFGADVRKGTSSSPEVTVQTRETGLVFAKRRVLMDDYYDVPYTDEMQVTKDFNNHVYKTIFNIIQN